MTIDPTMVSFSQAQGLESFPQPLKLGELNREARTDFWNAFFKLDRQHRDPRGRSDFIWLRFLEAIHSGFFREALDDFRSDHTNVHSRYKTYIMRRQYNEVFDLLLFIMRRTLCPATFKAEIKYAFESNRLAYVFDGTDPVTIYPATTPEEGKAIIDAVHQLSDYGLGGARQHLMQSTAFINQGEWAQSVHESISAVESVARQIAPGTNSLGAALNQLRRDGLLEHRALEQGLGNLYGYTSDEQGVRHSLLDQGQSNVGQDEAVFMMGACASFASYLWRKRLGAG